MRIIGHLPNQSSASAFSHFLSKRGIDCEVERELDGWAVWVHSEDECEQAKDWLGRFMGNPNDPKFSTRTELTPTAKEIDPALLEEMARKLGELQPGSISSTYGFGPLTVALLFGCVLLGLLSGWGASYEWLAPLFLTTVESAGSAFTWKPGLPEVMTGQVWRVVTPIMIHLSFMQFFFNLLWFLALGSQVEARDGTRKLAFLVLIIAVVSNLGQYALGGPYFGGMSGVIYGLLGYVWMKFRYQPERGFYISLPSISILMVWYFLCLLEVFPAPIPNAAQTIGLLLGFVLGWGSVWRQGGAS